MNLENGLKKEWILTNGIGGFSYSTEVGCNTRKYHGLLVAALNPPARRFLILSKLDEALVINNKEHILYTNMGKSYISEGYKNLAQFEKEYVPIFSYKIKETEIKKLICLEYGKNTVCVYYKIKNGNYKAKFKIAPIVNFRDFHNTNSNHDYKLNQTINNTKIKIIVDDNSYSPIYMYLTDGKYIEHYNDNFKNMYYIEEEKRGFYPEEDLSVPGVYEVELKENEKKDIYFICSLENNIEEIDAKNVISNEIIRINKLVNNSGLINIKKETDSEEDRKYRELIKKYIIAADNFVVDRPNFNLHTIIAGYPWFLDWGRDSMIAFEGILLIPHRYDIAREVLLTFVRDIKFGLVPNGYSGFDNRPLYNSVDASLLLFEQVEKYLRYTGDNKFIYENIYEKLKNIIDSYSTGIDIDDNNIYLDKDNLISSGTKKTQNTWMDAKYLDIPATPRNGKVVEVNALWYNALKILENLALKFENKNISNTYKKMAEKTKQSFNEKFYNKKRKCLYDVLGDGKIRPNQLFALSLSYPVIDCYSEEASNIINVVVSKLLNNYGLKTLAKGEPNYIEVYEGDGFKRDMSYHQGITWPWLLGLYYDSLKNTIKYTKNKESKKAYQDKLDSLIINTKKTFISELDSEGIVGSISELFDSKKPYLPKGALAQAWSVAEIFRIILEK
jgi:predicted glycogen debranching enzyme